MKIRTALLLAALLAAPAAARAQDPPPTDLLGFPDLVAGLRAVPGILGVDTAVTYGGKQVIFAWFADKDAVLAWYHSDMHRDAQDRFFPDRHAHSPLEHVSAGTGPILVVASVTPAGEPELPEAGSLPISQIAVELYAPLPGGFALGGSFAPESMEIPHLMRSVAPGGHGHD